MSKIATSFKHLIQHQLAKHQRAIANVNSIPSPNRLISVLNTHSIHPKTVIDIGVAYGTPWLYDAFPSASFHLIDPTRESLPFMNDWAKKLCATVHNVALGEKKSRIQIHTRDTIISSTLLTDLTKPELSESYDVEMVRFDALDIAIKTPCLCKIDVEGAEHMVLEGMGNRLEEIDLFVVETSLNCLYENGQDFSYINAFFVDNNFCLFDITEFKRRPFDSALHQIDAVFVRKSSPMRVKRWA